eukprot:TRINITY_DN263_c0_g1_i4.p1 TRINITY_DN263_c0_g1~~TRINITY_DN263_c0_g1_i4.p1  ORF type:complete len:860 (+),score=127.71 TRINITY_DN263_c0_g1_i4:381-2582(+)
MAAPVAKALKNVQDLDFSRNNISILDDKYAEMKSLKKLNLSHNKISSTPRKMFNISGLCELDLSHNKIKKLQGIKNLNDLAYLNLTSNELTTIPKEVGTCVNLEVLELNDNNNLDSIFLSLMAEDGTNAVLEYLRDERPAPSAGSNCHVDSSEPVPLTPSVDESLTPLMYDPVRVATPQPPTPKGNITGVRPVTPPATPMSSTSSDRSQKSSTVTPRRIKAGDMATLGDVPSTNDRSCPLSAPVADSSIPTKSDLLRFEALKVAEEERITFLQTQKEEEASFKKQMEQVRSEQEEERRKLEQMRKQEASERKKRDDEDRKIRYEEELIRKEEHRKREEDEKRRVEEKEWFEERRRQEDERRSHFEKAYRPSETDSLLQASIQALVEQNNSSQKQMQRQHELIMSQQSLIEEQRKQMSEQQNKFEETRKLHNEALSRINVMQELLVTQAQANTQLQTALSSQIISTEPRKSITRQTSPSSSSVSSLSKSPVECLRPSTTPSFLTGDTHLKSELPQNHQPTTGFQTPKTNRASHIIDPKSCSPGPSPFLQQPLGDKNSPPQRHQSSSPLQSQKQKNEYATQKSVPFTPPLASNRNHSPPLDPSTHWMNKLSNKSFPSISQTTDMIVSKYSLLNSERYTKEISEGPLSLSGLGKIDVNRNVSVHIGSHSTAPVAHVRISKNTTIADLKNMISNAVGVEQPFHLKKRHIPIRPTQDRRAALDFFRSDADAAVITVPY